MTDEDIDTSDIPPLSEKFFAAAKLRLPVSLEPTVAVRVDAETLAWFQHQGKEAEKHIAAALIIYMDASKLSSISKADTDEKIGEFWDTHDFTDFDTDAPDVEFEIAYTVPPIGCYDIMEKLKEIP